MFKTQLLILLAIFRLASASDAVAQNERAYELVVFMAPKCPICQDYTAVLNELNQTFGNKVSFVAYFPNAHTSEDDVIAFADRYALNFEAHPGGLDLAKQLGATLTPEVFLINDDGEILYSGRIDNRFFALGKRRTKVTEHSLQKALEQLTQGTNPHPNATEAVGCIIEYP